MKSRVIFASVVLGLGLTISQADAATTTNTDDSPTANKSASAMLVNGSQKQFAAYVGQLKLAQTTSLTNFMSVVSLFNQKPAAVLTLSAADRTRFNEAATQINDQLARQNKPEASRWKNQANYTTRMINFLWDVQKSNSEGSDIQ